MIHNVVVTDGVDCDGRMSSYQHCVCPVEHRHAQYNDYSGYLMPAWQVADAGQRDYAAESLGY